MKDLHLYDLVYSSLHRLQQLCANGAHADSVAKRSHQSWFRELPRRDGFPCFRDALGLNVSSNSCFGHVQSLLKNVIPRLKDVPEFHTRLLSCVDHRDPYIDCVAGSGKTPEADFREAPLVARLAAGSESARGGRRRRGTRVAARLGARDRPLPPVSRRFLCPREPRDASRGRVV